MTNGNGKWGALVAQVTILLTVVGAIAMLGLNLVRNDATQDAYIKALEQNKADKADLRCIETKLQEMDKKLDQIVNLHMPKGQ